MAASALAQTPAQQAIRDEAAWKCPFAEEFYGDVQQKQVEAIVLVDQAREDTERALAS